MKTLFLTAALMFAFVFQSSAFETTAITPTPTIAQPIPMSNWDKLGQKRISFNLERDIINVGIVEGLFTAIKLRVNGNDIDLHKLVIKFSNGTRQNVMVRKNIPSGGQTREIQLNGGGHRIIKEVVLYYEKETAAQSANVEVWGKHN